jgi:hypothetical protein
LAASATINVSVPGWYAQAGSDYNLGSLQMRTQDALGHWSTWAGMADSSDAVLTTGTLGFELRIDTINDGVQEMPETIAFVVRQTEWDSALENSWWVSQNITIEDVPVALLDDSEALTLVGNSVPSTYSDMV